MTRSVRFHAFAAVLFPLVAALFLGAQSQSFRDLYRAWREADPNLELDAATLPADALASRARKAASLASAYAAAHAAALKAIAGQQAPNQQWLAANHVQPLPSLAPAADEVRFINRETAGVAASISTFANDPDRAIQQLRQSFQREQEALAAIKTAVAARQQAEDKALQSATAAELAREKATQDFAMLPATLNQSADAVNQESAAWANYYSKLAAAAPAPATQPTPASLSAAATRYAGVWTYNSGAYFGSQPEMVEFTVREDNGHATGSFNGRFTLPAGSTGDPLLRFEFSGELKPGQKQAFKLTTNDGAAGTIVLTPGLAFNELEISFDTDIKPGKVHQGDMILLKQ